MIGPNVNVRVEFVGTLDDGTVFDSSETNGPLEITTDCGQVIAGLDRAIQEMEVGETRTVRIAAADDFALFLGTLAERTAKLLLGHLFA